MIRLGQKNGRRGSRGSAMVELALSVGLLVLVLGRFSSDMPSTHTIVYLLPFAEVPGMPR